MQEEEFNSIKYRMDKMIELLEQNNKLLEQIANPPVYLYSPQYHICTCGDIGENKQPCPVHDKVEYKIWTDKNTLDSQPVENQAPSTSKCGHGIDYGSPCMQCGRFGGKIDDATWEG